MQKKNIERLLIFGVSGTVGIIASYWLPFVEINRLFFSAIWWAMGILFYLVFPAITPRAK